jgi:hypothetical protein
MIEGLRSFEIVWLEQFFSHKNSLRWKDVLDRSAPSAWLEHVLPWITTFSSSRGQSPIILPVFGTNGPDYWYAMVSDDSGAKALSKELMAFIGPSYSSFNGEVAQLEPSDAIENALKDRFGRLIYRIDPVTSEDRARISEALQTYLNLLRRRPEIPDRTQRPFGKVRGEFDRALLAGNEPDALRLRDELIGSGRVDAEQEKYLEIRMLAGLGRQFQLAHDYPLVKSVLGLSLPAQTIADLVGALYSTYIADIEGSVNDESVLTIFKNEISNNFGPLFAERKGVRYPNVLKAFLLYELAQKEPNRERCNAIISSYPEDNGRALLKRWVERFASPKVEQKSDFYESTRQALADEDYELALELSLKSQPDSWSYPAMLRCAVEIDNEDVTRSVLEALGQVPETDRLKWTKRDIARLQQLLADNNFDKNESRPTPIHPEKDWMSWVDYVESGAKGRPPLLILEDALPRWSPDSFASDPLSCKELADRIGNAGGDAEIAYRDAFAYFVEFFVDRPERPIRAFAPIYAMLIRIVAWNGVVTSNELELASAVVQALVNVAPSKEDYVEAIDAYSEIVSTNSAPGNLDWALNASEMLAFQASPDSESRLRFFLCVVGMARACSHRLSSVQYDLLTLLAKDYGCSGLVESFSAGDGVTEGIAHRIDFTGLIGIYTLTEQAGQRARQYLRKLFPHARVELNADHVATDKLKGLAANADIFVFAWKSSKHQAYFAAKDARGSQRILLPLGKGSASILDCVLTEIGAND